jgi:hypothetical protein
MLRTIGFVILSIVGTVAFGQTFHPDIPRAWDDKEVEGFEVPLAQRDRSPRYMTAVGYYALKVRTIYRSYPVYAAGREPAGYFESLKQKEPEIIVFDSSVLRTKEDWIRAGEAVFDDTPAPVPTGPTGYKATPGITSSTTKEGILPAERYVIRQRGLVEQNSASCTGCHARVLPDGTALKGGQIDFAVYLPVAEGFRQARANPERARQLREAVWAISGAP